jgi:hypothetical protein
LAGIKGSYDRLVEAQDDLDHLMNPAHYDLIVIGGPVRRVKKQQSPPPNSASELQSWIADS